VKFKNPGGLSPSGQTFRRPRATARKTLHSVLTEKSELNPND